MIYVFNDAEMKKLVEISEFQMNRLSPLSHTISKGVSKKEQEQAVDSLTAMELVYTLPDIPSRVTNEGALISKALFRPECTISFGRRLAFDDLTYALQLNNLWYIYTNIPQYGVHIVYAFLSVQMLAVWIDEQLLKNYKPTEKNRNKFKVVLTYEEWLTFLASQTLFIRRDISGKKSGERTSFERNALLNPSITRFFKTSFRTLEMQKYANIAESLFSADHGGKLFSKAIAGLIRKGLFAPAKSQQNTDQLTYTPMALHALDSQFLLDTAYFNIKKANKQYTLLLCLRKTGITILFDSGSDIHLSTTDSVPWLSYLKLF